MKLSTNQHPLFIIAALLLLLHTQQACQCLNQGKCQSEDNSTRCICPESFIGDKCQIQAQLIKQHTAQKSLSQNFTYFYFQPDETNYYKLIFTICMKKNIRNSFTHFSYDTEKNDGSINTSPSIYETAKFRLHNNTCTNFTSHYVSVKRRQDNSFKKIVIGLKMMTAQEVSQSSFFNYFINENSFKPQIDSQNGTLADEQIVTVAILFQLFVQSQSSNTSIIIFTAVSLLLILLSLAAYIKSKYNQRSGYTDNQMQEIAMDLARNWRMNPESMESRYKINHHDNIDVFMPIIYHANNSQTHIFDRSFATEESQGRIEQEQECCSICLQQFEINEQTRKTPCNHSYHRECIDNWFQNQMSCPVCRRKIDFTKEIRNLYYKLLCRQLAN